MRYENLIWDFDGTLFDTYPGMCQNLQQAMETVGVHIPVEALIPRFLVSQKVAVEYCAERAGIDLDAAVQLYRKWVMEHPLSKAEPFPGAEEIVAGFQAAGGRNFIFTHRGESVHHYLAEAGWTQYFTEVVPFGPAFERKPAPSGNLYLIDRHGLEREKTLAVGDRELDVLAARNAGIDACLFCKSEAETAADYRIHRFEELYALIGLERK